jgi:hypothetical protein
MDPVHHSGPGIFAMLDELNVLSGYEYNITPIIKNYQSLFICLGYHNYNHVLTLWEGQKLAEFLDAGGKIYMEGRKTWKDDPGTPVHPKFNLQWAGTATVFDTLTGIGGTFTQGLEFYNDATTPFSFYHLEPIEPANAILQDNDLLKTCAVAYDAGIYKTIGALFEYGTRTDISPEATRNLMLEYLEFFGIEMEPVEVEEQGGMEAWRQGSLEVWPNPASRQLTLSPTPSLPLQGEGEKEEADNITISDLFGRKIMSFRQISAFPYQIDISTLPPGMYIVRMTTDDGFSASAKFLKVAE